MGGQVFNEGRFNGMYADADDERLRIIGIDTEDGPEHPLWDVSDRNREADVSFAAQIVVDGSVGQPIKVRRDGKFYDVAIGRRRLAACRLIKAEPAKVAAYLKALGLPQAVRPVLVPIVIETGDDAKFATMVAAENAQRKDLSLLQKAQQATRLLDRVKDKRRVAVTYDVDVQTVTEWTKVLDLHPKVIAQIDKTISLSAATKLAPLGREEQVTKLAELVAAGGKVTIAKTKAAAKGSESAGLKRGEIRKVAESEEVDKAVRDFARVVLGELPASRVKGVNKAIGL